MKQQLLPGNTAPDFSLQSSSGATVSLKDFAGQQVVIIHNRCINCPFSMLNIHIFSEYLDLLEENNSVLLMIFPSSVERLRKTIPEVFMKENVHYLSDPSMNTYHDYGVQSSLIGQLRSLFQFQALKKAMKFISLGALSLSGNPTLLPGSFLVDEFQLIEDAKMASSLSDIISIERVKQWTQDSLKTDLQYLVDYR